MNFIFISPHFPKHYWQFCNRLKRNGVNVLGIGDAPYDSLSEELRRDLTEYYYLPSLENYDATLRAVAYLEFRHGKVDWIESNNEYWLSLDARLRTDFNVRTGFQLDDIEHVRNKSGMKKFYAKAGVPTARLHKVTDFDAAKKFIDTVGYPVIAKPDSGIGACDTFKLSSDDDLKNFFDKNFSAPYVMEEFITGDIFSYDAIVDAQCEPLFETMTTWPVPVIDTVSRQMDLNYYVAAQLPESLRKVGRATVKAFGAKSRFVHFEFFRLTKTKAGLGNVGDFVGLEVNMRPAGGYTTDMMNFAHSTDVYQIWADMVTANKRLLPDSGEHGFSVYAGRRDCYEYVHSLDEVWARYGGAIVMCERMPESMVPQMGNQMFTVKLPTQEAVEEFIHFVQERR